MKRKKKRERKAKTRKDTSFAAKESTSLVRSSMHKAFPFWCRGYYLRSTGFVGVDGSLSDRADERHFRTTEGNAKRCGKGKQVGCRPRRRQMRMMLIYHPPPPTGSSARDNVGMQRESAFGDICWSQKSVCKGRLGTDTVWSRGKKGKAQKKTLYATLVCK